MPYENIGFFIDKLQKKTLFDSDPNYLVVLPCWSDLSKSLTQLPILILIFIIRKKLQQSISKPNIPPKTQSFLIETLVTIGISHTGYGNILVSMKILSFKTGRYQNKKELFFKFRLYLKKY